MRGDGADEEIDAMLKVVGLAIHEMEVYEEYAEMTYAEICNMPEEE